MFNTELDEVKKKTIVAPVAPKKWQTNVYSANGLDRFVISLGRDQHNQDSIRLAINEFIVLKARKVIELSNQSKIVSPQNLYLDNNDKGKFTNPALRKFDHYHLKVRDDPRKGDITLVYKQEIDQDNKILNLYITAVCTHADYDKSSFAKSCNSAEYNFIKTMESQLSNS